ncbi:MAG TPA: Uma2 family endonuclease [Terriglobales bacterium]|jgi:hypothetical protein
MATLQTSLSEYLRTSYHPDRDYVDGEVQERNWGEFDHAAVQVFLSSWFFQHRQEWELHVLVEMRVRVAAERVRIPDVCLVARGGEIEQVLTKPPLAVIEYFLLKTESGGTTNGWPTTVRWAFQMSGSSIPQIEWATTAARQRGCRLRNFA